MTQAILERSLKQVLTAPRLAEVRELAADDCSCAAQAADVLRWMRLNMPLAAQRVEELATPSQDW